MVEAKPHWGLSASLSKGMNCEACRMRCFSSSLFSRVGFLELTSPNTTYDLQEPGAKVRSPPSAHRHIPAGSREGVSSETPWPTEIPDFRVAVIRPKRGEL